jgi:hypothetical protein
MDSAGPAPGDAVPVILLNAGDGGPSGNGYSWRLGRDRIEIYGDSNRGLCNGVFDFLDALGIRWPESGREQFPSPAAGGEYPLAREKAYAASVKGPENRRRFVIPSGETPKKAAGLVRWAARNRCDAIVVSLRDTPPPNAARYSLIVERGGWDLSLLVPRRYFFFHRDLFRMEEGRRTRRYNFCPTNPDTIAILGKELARLCRRIRSQAKKTRPRTESSGAAEAEESVWHLWPDRGHEKTWCSCPACRAFSLEEQNRIAANAAAAVLEETAPGARLSYLAENPDEEDSGGNVPELSLRPGIFVLDKHYNPSAAPTAPAAAI